jgi:periplasmic protein TonB
MALWRDGGNKLGTPDMIELRGLRVLRDHMRPLLWPAMIGAVMVIAGCGSSPMPAPSPVVPAPSAGSASPAPSAAMPPAPRPSATAPPSVLSAASSPREFRRDAATQIYKLNANRIYKGKLQPLLYAVGVFEVDIDSRGNVVKTSWLRAPSHAPEVMAEIDRIVRQAAPYPAPVKMGRVTYTDVWLWDKSGSFQLDTLTEGQL